ncbi:hypothetical protein [Lactiplantibacillus songbeiensis]|uniref:Immunity protein n=1 Tax=Lactiplantibacillus songbeiensis TaxID=2559920 RepID=A0ABW4BXB3_9LACO|nr:hypothetical protein [Lactiplantibacillus songbeiensis]
MVVDLAGIILIFLSVWQVYAVKQAFLNTKHNGNHGTSVFIGYGLWSGLIFGIIIFFAGMTLLINGLM